MKRFALLAVLFAVAACGSFGVAQPHTLSLAYKAGDTYNYKIHVSSKQTATMSVMSIPITLDLTAKETVSVKSVDSAGVADLSVSLSQLTMKTVTNGVTNTTTGIPTSTVDVKVKPDGTMVSADGTDLTGGGGPLTAFSGIGGGFFVTAVLPDHAVKVGDKWSKTYDQAFTSAGGKMHVVSDSTYLRDETVNNVSAAVVETKSTGTIDFSESPLTSGAAAPSFTLTGNFTTDVTTWIDPNGHRVVKSHALAHDAVTINVPTMSGPGPVEPNMPAMSGPLTATGDSTTDLNPA